MVYPFTLFYVLCAVAFKTFFSYMSNTKYMLRMAFCYPFCMIRDYIYEERLLNLIYY